MPIMRSLSIAEHCAHMIIDRRVFNLVAVYGATMLLIMRVMRGLSIAERCAHVQENEAICLPFEGGNS